jgi:hypothetical protein
VVPETFIISVCLAGVNIGISIQRLALNFTAEERIIANIIITMTYQGVTGYRKIQSAAENNTSYSYGHCLL